jgi:UDP-N-acetylglucosamine--N-acetylmuramyl-(pentapeptide) pyrophosphoryl-undecaprenol N-acetylglucosamine transferase
LISEGNQIIWQTGKGYYETAKVYAGTSAKKDLKVFDFIREMDLAYAAADIIVSRAGAMSISELCLTGKAVVLIPSPNVSEDHQTKNAMSLVNKNAAVLLKDDAAQDDLYGVFVCSSERFGEDNNTG